MFRRWAVALTALVAAAAAVPYATLLVPTEFRTVVAESTLIVRGHITDVRAVIAAGGRVESIGTIAVDAVVKGAPATFAYVRVPGGLIGRYRTTMVGAPKLTVGDTAIFFLKRGADDAYRPVGLSLGIYRVRSEPRTGRAIVDPPVVHGVNASTGPVVRGDSRRQPMPVQEFESLVKLVMAGTPPRIRR